MTRTPRSRTKRPRRIRSRSERALIVAGGILAALVVLAVVSIAALRLLHSGVLPGVTVGGIEAAGLGESELRAELEAIASERGESTVSLTSNSGTIEVTLADLGYRAHVEDAVAEAIALGRDGGIFASAADQIASLWWEVEIPLEESLDAQVLAAWLDTLQANIDREAFDGALRIDPADLTVSVDLPHSGRALDRGELERILFAAFESEGDDEAVLPVATTPPRVDAADVDLLGRRADLALGRSLVLTSNGTELVIEPERLAEAIGMRVAGDAETGYRPELFVDSDRVARWFAPLADSLYVPPVEAKLAVPSALPFLDEKGDVTWSPLPPGLEVAPAQPARGFDADVTAGQIVDLVMAGATSSELRLATFEDTLPPIDVAAGFENSMVIGTFTTYHSCCQQRVKNIQLMADMVRGTIVMPGEKFSINEVVGERTEAKGFVPAPAIFQGELRDEVGGGVSQFATTIFNAAFFAGIPIDEHQAHSLYISRYPRGREATLNYPVINFVFTNDTDYPIYVHTAYTDTSITVTLFGNNGGRTVTAVMGGPYAFRDPHTIERENPALAPGESKEVQDGHRGFTVDVLQIIRYGDGTVKERTFVTRYQPQPQVIEYGPVPCPPPEGVPPPEGCTVPPDNGGGSGGSGSGGSGSGGSGGGGGGGSGGGGSGGGGNG